MSDLDSPELYERLDPSGMAGRIEALPDLCRQGWDEGRHLKLPSAHRQAKRVLVLGMGGSAISGDLLAAVAAACGGPPVGVGRGYNLPPGVDETTLVIASSKSGETEETIAAFEQALGLPCPKLAITTGGALANIAEANGVPLLHFHYPHEPRAVVGQNLFSLLGVLCSTGLLGDISSDVDETAAVLEEANPGLAPAAAEARNLAKQLARSLHGRITVCYGAGFLSPVARRWKTQINENGKAWAVWEELPEAHHNSVVGYRLPPSAKDVLHACLLAASALPSRLQTRVTLTAEVLRQADLPYTTLAARGESVLAQMLSLLQLGDWTSYYLAVLNGADPSPVPAIDYLKRRLAQL